MAAFIARAIDRPMRARQQPTRLAWLRAHVHALSTNQTVASDRPIRTPERLSRQDDRTVKGFFYSHFKPERERLNRTSEYCFPVLGHRTILIWGD